MARSLSLLRRVTNYNRRVPNQNELGIRQLYSQSTLGVNKFIETREQVRSQFRDMIDKFKERMNGFIDERSQYMIFTEDLKNMLFLADENDIDLVTNMIRKYNNQTTSLSFGSYVFGPVVMRMFYYLHKPDEALKMFHMTELRGFFDQVMSYQILLDLLYENVQYNDVLRTYDFIKTKQNQAYKYPKYCLVIVLAACYKLNNKNSLEYMVNLWRELKQANHIPMRRVVTFAAALAYHQKEYNMAIDILSNSKDDNYVVVRNIKMLSLAELGRMEDALMLLKMALQKDVYQKDDDRAPSVATLPKNVIDSLRTLIEWCDNKEWNYEFDRIVAILKAHNQICDKTLDQLLCQEIEVVKTFRPVQFKGLHQNYAKRNIKPYRPNLSNLE